MENYMEKWATADMTQDPFVFTAASKKHSFHHNMMIPSN